MMARGGNNLPITHADVVKGSSIAENRDCDLALEFQGWKMAREDGSSYVDWFGSFHHREVFCPEHGSVSTIRVSGGGKDDGPVSSSSGDTITEF